MSDGYHALASPSSAHRWMNCANALAMEIGQPEGDTKAADLGTDKHELLTLCLEFGKNAMDYNGHVLKNGHTVVKEFAADVQTVIDNVRERTKAYELRGATVTMRLAQDVPISHITGEKDATGELDISLIVSWPDGDTDLDVIDAKFGYQEVDATRNEQLTMYAAGELEQLSLTEEFRKVNLVIEQPLRGVSEYSMFVQDVEDFVKDARPAAEKALMIHRLALEGQRALKESDFAPSEKTCMWCKAKAVCPALKAKVEGLFQCEMDELEKLDATLHGLTIDDLADVFPHLELVEDWINAVRARIEAEVFAGHPVPGVKVVAGKKGNRAWVSDEEAEAMMKKFKMKQEQMYSLKLLGPKPILDALKDQPRRLKQIESLVVQPAGKPHVVLDTDPRPALEIKPVEDGFEAEEEEELC
jgi:hypothetical protein